MKHRLHSGMRRILYTIKYGIQTVLSTAILYTLRKPHRFMLRHSRTYRRWNGWKFHTPGNVAALFALLFIASLIITNLGGPAFALSTWTQTTWNGGVGPNTQNQYQSVSSIDTATANQLTLERTPNRFSNPDMSGNLNGWDGINKQYAASPSYTTGSGSAEVTAPAVPETPFYDMSTVSGSGMILQYATVSGDFNNDGIDDQVTAAPGLITTARVLFGNGNGSFVPGPMSSFMGQDSVALVTGDFNNDGQLDYAGTAPSPTVGSNAMAITVMLNNGNGSAFTRVVSDNLAIEGGDTVGDCTGAPGDVNGDGSIDMVLSCAWSSYVYVAINNGSGTFDTSTTAYPVSQELGYNQQVVLSDFNNDDNLDIALAWPETCGISVFFNNGDGTFGEANEVPGHGDCTSIMSQISQDRSAFLATGDMNNDGNEDVVMNIVSPEYTSMRIFLGDGSGGFDVPEALPSTPCAGDVCVGLYYAYVRNTQVALADIDLDGALDIVAAFGEKLVWYKNNGDNTFESYAFIYGSEDSTGWPPMFFAIGDFVGDGRPDIAAPLAASDAGNIGLFFNATDGDVLSQKVDLGNSDTYTLEAYVYTDGSPVTSNEVTLYSDGEPVNNITYEATDEAGWYKVKGEVTGSNEPHAYGVQVKPDVTAYIDHLDLYAYAQSGTLTSAVYDLTYGGDWQKLLYSATGPGSVAVKVRSSNNADMSGAPAFAGCSAIANDASLSTGGCMTDNQRYVQYQVTLTSADGDTPTFTSITVQYLPWDKTPPNVNASDIIMKQSVGGAVVESNGWTNSPSPYFEWTAGEDEGSGIKGYCLYLGQDASADPVTTKGLLGNSPVNTENSCQFAVAPTNIDLATSGYLNTALTSSNDPYYLLIKAIDSSNNVYDGDPAEFQFRFDNTPPTNPAYISAPSQFVANKDVTFTWPTNGADAASDQYSGVAGLQYRIGDNTPWYGDEHNGQQNMTDLLPNDGNYQTIENPDYANIHEGNNVVYFRTWDQAGNVTTTAVTTVLKYNATSPSTPQNITATPPTNDTNSFAFSWTQPATFVGPANALTYCYTVNTLPTINTCTFTAAGVTSLPAAAYATQPGENTLYVVAKDQAGNINYATAGNVTFTTNTTAPGVPLNVEVTDVSIKATSTWQLALSWTPPSTGTVAQYKIWRSTNNVSFSQIGTSASTNYVDSGLTQQLYYYKIQACDSSNNCGAYSATVEMTPTGRYNTPPAFIGQPSVTVGTRTATIRWTTDREADSRIQYGLKSGVYFPTEAINPTQTKSHEVTLNNLDAGRTYYYKALWMDSDNNLGSTSELTFTTLPPPTVTDVHATNVGMNTATIDFTSKDASQVKIKYGKTDRPDKEKTINTSRNESSYAVQLSDLDDGTQYFYSVNPIDSEGNEYASSRIDSFTTLPRPRISNLRLQPLPEEPGSTQVVTWDTNVPASSLVRFSPAGGGTPQEEYSSALTTKHRVVVRGLQDDTLYTFVAESRDAYGNLAVSDVQTMQTALDTRPPKISEVNVQTSIIGTGAEARGQIVVSWKTDEPATSQVFYAEGADATVFNNKTAEDGNYGLEHIVIFSDLPTSKVYSVQPVSRDRSDNLATGATEPAIVGRASDSVMTVVLNTLKKIFGF